MVINESIRSKIEELSIGEEEKKLLKDILECQEHSGRQYSKQYTEIINDYLEKKRK